MTQATAKAKTETKTKTKAEVKRSVTINPGMICQPIGAMQAVLGVHGAISLVHGSQGCAAYPMRMFNRHFQEPVEIALSSLGEDAAVFGGADNLVKGVHALVARRQPELIESSERSTYLPRWSRCIHRVISVPTSQDTTTQ